MPEANEATHPAPVRRLREARGWTLSDLAQRAGCDPGYLSRVERGERTPSKYFEAHLLDVLTTDDKPDAA